MRKLIFLLCTGLFCLKAIGQETKFGKDGKISSIMLGPNNKIFPDVHTMEQLNKDEQKQVRESLQKKIEETLNAIDDKKGIGASFYFLAWGSDTAFVANDLRQLSNLLKEKNITSFDRIERTQTYHYLTNVVTAIRKSIYVSETFNFDNSVDRKATITQQDLYNLFLVNTFNAGQKNFIAGKDLSLAHYLDVTEVLTRNKRAVDSLLRIYRKAVAEGKTAEVQCGVKQRKDELMSTAEVQEVMRMLANDNWFKQWFWIRGGSIKLNPLDFTTDEYISRNPGFDIEKANIFNGYIDSLLARYIRRDSTQRVDDFKKLLSQKATGKDIFNFKARLDSLLAANKAALDKLVTTQTDLNTIEIPATDQYYSYSADPDIKFHNDSLMLKKALHTDETKTIVVHNVPAGTKAGIIETDKAIIDRSAAQQAIDSIASFGGQIMKIVSDLTPYAGIANVANSVKIASGVISDYPSSRANGRSAAFKIRELPAISKLKTMLIAGCSFDEHIFTKYFGEDLSIGFTQSTIDNEAKKYEKEFDSTQLAHLVDDSLRAMLLVDMYVNSTPPPLQSLEKKKASGSRYSSNIMSTKASDDPIEKKVSVYIAKGKEDTAWVDKFSYKVGKNYRYQLSAGIAYTMQNFSQVIASQDKGQITITDNVQQYRFVAGIHIYPGKGLYLKDDRFIGKPKERYSIYAGVGIPDPLGNLYAGLAYDLVPGVKLTFGAHTVKEYNYTIQNNTIVEKRLNYKLAGTFIALQIDPTSFISLLKSFKQN